MYDPQALKWVSTLLVLVLQPSAFPLSPVASASPCTLPSPRNVHFVSKNMKNILHWSPPEGIAEDELSYIVKYLIYGTDKWIKNSACKNISQTWCDLSLETYDHKELYHASVKAFTSVNCSSWAESLRFNPLTDSQIVPPEFAISSTEKSVSIIVVPPQKWKRNPREKPKYLHQIYPDLQYNVSIFNKAIRKKWMFSIKNNRLDVFQLESNTVYCVTVQVYITPLLLSGYSKENCIATLKDPSFKLTTTILLEYILPALLIGLFIFVSSCCIYRYIHITEQTYPKNLVLKNRSEHPGDLFVPSEKMMINLISINIVEQSKTSQEDIHLQGNTEGRAGDCAGSNAEKEPSKIPEDKHSQEICHNEEAEFKNEQDGKVQHLTRVHYHDSQGQRQSEDVVYEFDVRSEDAVPTEERQEELCLKHCTGAQKGQLYSSPKALSGLAMNETEQSYCPQYDVRPPGAFSEDKLKELLSDKMVPVNIQVSLINLVTFDQDFCPGCGVATDICLVPDKKEPFWNEKGVALSETQTLTFTMMRNAAASYYPQLVTLASQEQEGVEGDHDQNTVIDWDPQTGTPFLPDLSNLTNKEITQTEKHAELQEERMLSRLYNRQCSDDLSEGQEEVYLLQLKEQWGLEIQMQT